MPNPLSRVEVVTQTLEIGCKSISARETCLKIVTDYIGSVFFRDQGLGTNNGVLSLTVFNHGMSYIGVL